MNRLMFWVKVILGGLYDVALAGIGAPNGSWRPFTDKEWRRP